MADPMTAEDLQALCREWQRILRLQDWDIKVELKRERDFVLEGVQGENHVGLEHREALICILDPIDWPPEAIGEQDMERTLVHELIHCHFEPFFNRENWQIKTAQEQAIETLAKALVKLKRNGSAEG